MSEYISLKEALSIPATPKQYRRYQTANLDDAYEQGWEDCQKVCIERLPREHVVELTRCGKCRHYEWHGNRVPEERAWVCEVWYAEMGEDDFCSKGKKRDGEDG